MSTTSDPQIENVLKEGRVFPPPAEFSAQARVKSLAEFEALYQESVTDPEGFWAKHASDLHWFEPWSQVLKWDAPHAEWFVGGKTNLSYNCLDRHVHGPNRNKAAIIFEGEPGDVQVLTYYALWREVQRFANVLKGLGLKSGDRVAIYMPMIPEAAIAMLACARIGVIHSVIFGGFSSEAIAERVNDAGAKVIITCDGGWRRGSVVPLKANVDNALHHHHCPTIEKVIVHRRTGNTIQMHPGRDVEWSDLMAAAAPDCPAEPLDSEHPLFILYTSGSTGKPKGVMHTTAGYMLYTYLTTGYVFDLKPTDVHWCTADVGWVTGHSYVVYGPLANGATTLLYEGAPNYPDWDRNWSIIERHGVTVFYTAPTAIRTFFRHGNAFPEKHDLSSLRLLGTVGEPINPEAWIWYHKVIGGGRCPIVDTWWQTETGGIMITSLPGAVPQKPASAGRPFFGIQPAIVNKDGNPVGQDEGGFLIITHPWPGMLRTLWGDDERFKQAYWSQHPGAYFTGDGARRDSDGDYWLLGRIDDVVNISGHRLGTAEVESTLVGHHSVAESAVIGRPDEITGEALVAFVTLKGNQHRSPSLKEELIEFVAEKIGKFARPAELRFTDALPKTRSGKIMRRLLRKVAVHDPSLGDTTTLEDISVLSKLQEDED